MCVCMYYSLIMHTVVSYAVQHCRYGRYDYLMIKGAIRLRCICRDLRNLLRLVIYVYTYPIHYKG